MNIIEKKAVLAISKLKQFIYTCRYKHLSIGKKVYVKSGFRLQMEDEAVISIGDRCFFNNDCSITARESISIGNDCLFGEGVKIYDHNHVFKHIPTPIAQQGFSEGGVLIGNNVWIGSNVIILKGTEIGDNCVIAAESVVDSCIPDNSILRRNGTIDRIISSN